jgi:hypothetical protein
MSSPEATVSNRIATLTAVLPNARQRSTVESVLQEAGGDWSKAEPVLRERLPEPAMQKLVLANHLAEWSGDDIPLVQALTADPQVNSLRDVAAHYGVTALADMLSTPAADAAAPQPATPTPPPTAQQRAIELRRGLFTAAPTAVVQRMAIDNELPIPDATVRSGVATFLGNKPDLDLTSTSIYTALQHPEAFSGVAADAGAAVTDHLKTLQRLITISPVPEAIPVLMDSRWSSAFDIAQVPESTFTRTLGSAVGEDAAATLYTNALNTHIRNETALASMGDTLRGSGVAIVDGTATREDRIAAFDAAAAATNTPANLHDLFGSLDQCECDDCLSIYSPAAYFVDLLQFLRNNNTDPTSTQPPGSATDIKDTVLEKLFRRRPDLKCLELTCENTFTVLPYIDLANEVMESFVVHLGDYANDTHDPKQATLDVFNVGDETTTELLAQPQHVNYQAYCILKNAVYPFTLPYHQPIDVARIWLPALGTSRYELLDTFRTATETCPSANLTPAQQAQLDTLHAHVYDRAIDAEFLGITQEEYIILTHEAFWEKQYFELTTGNTYTDDEYHAHIGVKNVWQYYGYTDDTQMLDTDEAGKHLGLTFVVEQFLPRTGIHYTDLVDIVRTRFINPNLPTGHALTLMDAIAFSYRFLQSLVDPTDPNGKYAKLIAFLNTTQPLVPWIDAILHPDPCHQLDPCHTEPPCGCGTPDDFTNWVECYFERIGQLIVLDAGEGPQLPVTGTVTYGDQDTPNTLGTLTADGLIKDANGHIVARVLAKPDGTAIAVGPDFAPLKPPFVPAEVFDADNTIVAFIDQNGNMTAPDEEPVQWSSAQELCDLNTVRLTHLDGSALTDAEYDRIQRFIRLWRKLGWTISETDQALVAVSAHPPGGGSGTGSDTCEFVGFDTFQNDCAPTGTGGDCGNGDDGGGSGCPDIPPAPDDISPATIHQLAAIRHLLDTTGLELDKALALWGDIGTTGDHPLYARLFLTHNVLGIDTVFRSDANGNYLTGNIKLSDHQPGVLAALKLKAAELAATVADRQLPDTLTVHTLTVLYRYILFAGLLRVRVTELPDIFALLGDPFTDPQTSRDVLQVWQDMQDAGFTYRQLDYITKDRDNPIRPAGPSPQKILQISKTLYDGLTAIAHDHPDLPADDTTDATDELVRTSAALVFDPTVADQILGLLDGTTAYTTNAPAGLTVTIPDPPGSRLKYATAPTAQPPTASLQITGILTASDIATAKTLSTDPGWAKAIDRAGKQAGHFYHDVLAAVLPADTEPILLAADNNPPPTQADPAPAGTAAGKRLAFLRGFLPYLRNRLAHKLIVDTAAGVAGLTADTTDLLLSSILHVGTTPQSALDVLRSIADTPPTGTTGWRGYLIPATTAAYTFVVVNSDTQPGPLTIDGTTVPFPHQQDDPSNVWSSDPVPITASTLHPFDTGTVALTQLQWKTPTSTPAAIPSAALLPDHSTQGVEHVFKELTKAALIINGFTLTTTEAAYLQAHGADFDGFDFNAVNLTQWKRLRAYTNLRDNVTGPTSTLIDLFGWAAATTPSAAKLPERIAGATGWDQASLAALLTPAHFNLEQPDAFRNEVHLITLQRAIGVATRSTATVDRLFTWANPTSSFWPTHAIAADIQAALRARYTQSDWEQVVKPLYDQLRGDQRDALIAYLLIQQPLRDWGVIDADSLFEFFLLDVQMGACLDTSRIKQAISSVQTFVQRCVLGLEKDRGVKADVLDRRRWDWMQKYRVWEANRKVFAYPENWLKADLRDDPSPLFTQMQAALLQKDINPTTIDDALHAYVSGFDTVANLQPAGLAIENGTDGTPAELHVFARTRMAPHQFYHRYYDIQAGYWYPWQHVNLDVPSYTIDRLDAGKAGENGTYLIPVVFNNRLLVFFPQFRRKTAAAPTGTDSFKQMGDKKVSDHQNIQYWEIAMAWSEYRNGTWLQKQISTGTLIDPAGSTPGILPDLSAYEFVPRIATDQTKVNIDAYSAKSGIGGFVFSGSQLFTAATETVGTLDIDPTDFHYLIPTVVAAATPVPQLHSIQGIDTAKPKFAAQDIAPYFADSNTDVTAHPVPGKDNTSVPAADSLAHQLVGALAGGGVDGLYAFYTNLKSGLDDVYGATKPGDPKTSYHELALPYALYHWEIGFHAITLLVDRLLVAGQFDVALQTMHRVLNPFAAGTPADPVWRFAPFGATDPRNDLEKLFLGLKPNTPDPKITEWRNNPFQPHVVARGRPGAYMRWVAMTYIRIWIAYGDYYFRQGTLETLPLAIQCYIVAAHVYGPRGEIIPNRGKIVPQTYASLLDKWDAFSNAMVELELVFPFSNQTPLPLNSSNGVVGLANIFGFATSLYFCIPDNPDLTALRDLIDDRLFKIRHCQDINGVFRELPLFESPIDPALLVAAAAQGLSLATVLNDLNAPTPNYRFAYLLQKAFELCGELKALGNALVAAREKRDAEALAQLRAGHETSINNLVMEVRKKQADEADKALDALQESRKGPVYRLQHQLKLIGADLAAVPADPASDFTELADSIEPPIDTSGLKLSSLENEEMNKASDARDMQLAVGIVETLASVLHVIPDFHGHATPLGVGAAVVWGGQFLGNATQAVARGLQIGVNELTYQSSNAGRKATFQRQLQERVQAANVAGYEVSNIDKQILTQQIRQAIAAQEITNQQQLIDNAQAVEDFLSSKYSNTELYAYMDAQIRGLYYQTYTMAYDLAKKAEKLFVFERGPATAEFIKFGYWDPARDGLLAGDNLYNALKKLEAAYQSERGYDFEVTKPVSLRQLDPIALMDLREKGSCEFWLPEVMFDMDYPGHYQRRIKNITVTIPAVVGPYTGINATLRLLEHSFRNTAVVANPNDYPRKIDSDDPRFTTVNVPITAIAVSTGQNDSGLFELNFRDERYLPFEGAGVISKWRLELPIDFRQFDYQTITDVIVQLRYTAINGGDKLAAISAKSLHDDIKSVENLSRDQGLFAAFDLRHEFPDEWYKATHNTPAVLTLANLDQRLPFYTRGHAGKIQATDIYLYTPAHPAPTGVTLTEGGNDTPLAPGPAVGTTLATFDATELSGVPIDTWQLRLDGAHLTLDTLWLVMRYTLG